jgi:hypothetical protein
MAGETTMFGRPAQLSEVEVAPGITLADALATSAALASTSLGNAATLGGLVMPGGEQLA